MRPLILPLILMLLSYSSPAQAYLDPGTGTMIVSAIIGIFGTLILAVKTYWYKLLRLFRKRDPDAREVEKTEELDSDQDRDKDLNAD